MTAFEPFASGIAGIVGLEPGRRPEIVRLPATIIAASSYFGEDGDDVEQGVSSPSKSGRRHDNLPQVNRWHRATRLCLARLWGLVCGYAMPTYRDITQKA